MSDDKTKNELLFARQLYKATAELLMDLIDASNDAELSFEERAAALMQAGALLFNDRGDRGIKWHATARNQLSGR